MRQPLPLCTTSDSNLFRYRLGVSEYQINAGAWFNGLSAESLASGARRIDKPFTIESLGERHHRLGRQYVIKASALSEAFQRAYIAFALDSSPELSMPELESVSLEWRPVERRT
jgi:hypothetical protein